MNIGTPEDVGLSPARLYHLSAVAQSYVDEGKVAGLITLVARHGKVAHLECYGMMDIEANRPMQLDTIFRIYSMTKPITSVALMILVEEGLVQLDDHVAKFISEFRGLKVSVGPSDTGAELDDLERDITIWNLLTHTAGFGYGDMYPEMFDPLSMLQPSLEDMVQMLAKLPLAYQPGSDWHYSIAHDVIGHLVGLVSGTPFDVFLEERVFGPLGMEDTGFFVPEDKLDRLAAMYTAPGEDGTSLLDAPASSPFARQDNVPSGGGGLVSTVSDYLRFARMLLDEGELDGARLLHPETIQVLTTNQLPDELVPIQTASPWPGVGYGLGFGVVVDPAQSNLGSEGTFGWIGTGGSTFWADPREGLVFLALVQASGFTEARTTLANLAHKSIVG